jgi:fatty acyl-CoA reductase
MYAVPSNINYPISSVAFTVVFTAHEPLVGWSNNVYGPLGLIAGAVAGILRSMHCDSDCIADVLPVDMVVNSAITVAWDLANHM